MTPPSQGVNPSSKQLFLLCAKSRKLMKVSAGPLKMTELSLYQPAEDSALLERYVKQHSKGSVLDIGTGSGIQAIAAAENKKVSSVLAVDIQEEVIGHCKANIKNKKIKFLVSDLFQIFKNNKRLKTKKFDTIIFNPPYLPSELKLKDLTTEGGKKGYEVIERFINQANSFLRADGIILLLFSSLTKKDKVDEFIKNNLLEFNLLEKQHIFFEDLYAYKINKSAMLKTLEKKGISHINYFTKGKRGFIFTGLYKNKKIAIKLKNPESEAVLRINNETNFLKILNKKGIGPKLLFSDKDYLAYEFVDGYFIEDYLKINEDKKTISNLIKKIMNQMFVMDQLKINKEEMSHPQKHILIDKKNKPVLIDFERAHYVLNPGNVTQFCDFMISNNVKTILNKNNIKINNKKIIALAKKYKKSMNKNNFNNILKSIK